MCEEIVVFADISELNLAKGSTIVFPEGKDKLLKFEITLRPDEGIYRYIKFDDGFAGVDVILNTLQVSF